MLVVVVNIECFCVCGWDIRSCVFAEPVIFRQIIGQIDCSAFAADVCVGITETCKHESELHSAKSVRHAFRAVLF